MATADFSRIATNIGALNALNSLNSVNSKLGMHQQRLATGRRINSAADDPAGLTIATKLNARSEGLKVASDNIADAKNLLTVAESGLSRINDIMIQMRNKSQQAASDTLGVTERKAVVEQLRAYSKQVDDIVDQTKWNGNNLIDGSYNTTALTFQTGADKGDTTQLDGLINVSSTETGSLKLAEEITADAANSLTQGAASIAGVATQTLGTGQGELSTGTYTIEVTYAGTAGDSSTVELKDGDTVVASSTGVDLSSANQTVDFGVGVEVDVEETNANASYTATFRYERAGDHDLLLSDGSTNIDQASSASNFADYMDFLGSKLDTVSGQLSKIGSLMGRLSFKEDQVAVSQVNVEASYNRIMNADMAREQLNATKYSILQQTSTTMLAQANTAPQGILGLFR